MDKFMKIGALALLSLAAVNFTSCKDDDPTFVNPDGPVNEDPKPTPPEEVIPDAPKVEVVVKSISGVVTNAGKNAKAQLQKAADGTAVGDAVAVGADGTFTFATVAAGEYTVQITADGQYPVTSEKLTIADDKTNQALLCAFTMRNLPEKVTLKKNDDGSQTAKVAAPSAAQEAVKGEGEEATKPADAVNVADIANASEADKEFAAAVAAVAEQVAQVAEDAKVEMEVNVPADALSDPEAEISVMPSASKADAEYLENAAAAAAAAIRSIARADETEDIALAGTKLECSKAGVTIKNPIAISFDVDPTIAKELVAQQWNAEKKQWEDVKADVKEGKVTINAEAFTSFVLVMKAKVATVAGENVAVTLEKTDWDNTKGSAAVKVDNINYTYKMGTVLNAKAEKNNKLQAYLINSFINKFGISAYLMKGAFPINIELPVGTGMKASGTQATTKLSVAFGNVTVEGVAYGATNIAVSTYSLKEHTGGSN